MTLKESKEGKIIILSKAFDNRAKILNVIYFAVFTFAAILFLRMALLDGIQSWGALIFVALSVGVYLFAGYRFINKSLETELLVVTQTNLKILRRGFLNHSENNYDISKISNFRHLEKPETTKHPLAGETFDYLGFQTEQQVINELHGDNRIGFDYAGRNITFGQNLYSWDFEQLEAQLYNITGRDFRHHE